MPKRALFNTDSRALDRRIEAHQKFGSRDINHWIFENVEIDDGFSVLELGCGTGKQTIPIARSVGDSGRVLALDASQQALDVLLQELSIQRLSARVDLRCCDLDELEPRLNSGGSFDVALGCFSLYYAKAPEKLFRAVHRWLRPGGVLFFCGPANDNNQELKQFHWALKEGHSPAETGASAFMEKLGPELGARIFAETRVLGFQNELRFDSAESLFAYWSSYNLYDCNLEPAFRVAAAKHFEKCSEFLTTKRVVGIKAIK